ncbi:EAL domain-containing protein [Paenarthrobacter sp. CAP02]|uniref:EAL domain-containing protein n=1 Tax=Paenarthrobacter sp. CAP02 TaxID=3158144 RepID=UPI0032DBF187
MSAGSLLRWWLVALFLDLLASSLVLLPHLLGFEAGGGSEILTNVATLVFVLLCPIVLGGSWALVRRHDRMRDDSKGPGRSISDKETSQEAPEIQARLERLFTIRALMTAFQPIRDLATGKVVGVEALTRFVSSPLRSPDQWFREAESVGRGADLEFLALETALRAAADLPEHLYIGVNLSPLACLDPRLGEAIKGSRIQPERIVVELTEHSVVANYADLKAALAPLREQGLRLAIDDTCDGFSSLRHIAMLNPEVIKLDRTISAGIDSNPTLRALCAAMVSFATDIDARLVAEGIETEAQLAVITRLGAHAGQGYLLGRPSVRPEDWARWKEGRDRAPRAGDSSQESDIRRCP